MTEPSQYFKGRTVQEQMNEVISYVDVRSAEVATNAIAGDVAQVHQDMLDADADASAAAASAAAAAGTLANAVKKTGEASQSIAGDIAVSGDLSAGGDLAITGDAGVQGQLSVLGGCDLRAPVKVPTVATGTFDDKAANGTKVKNELDNYAAMVRTTGNQPINGIKNMKRFSESVANGGPYTYTSGSTDFVKIGTVSRQGIFDIRITLGGGYTGAWDIINVVFHTFNITSHYHTAVATHKNASLNTTIYIAYNAGVDGYDLWLKFASTITTWIMIESRNTAYGNRIDNTDLSGSVLEGASDPAANYSTFTAVSYT